MKKIFIICYDIEKDRIRNKIRKILINYGERWQYSTYLCFFTDKELQTVSNDLEKLIAKNDSVIWIPVSFSFMERITCQGRSIRELKKIDYHLII